MGGRPGPTLATEQRPQFVPDRAVAERQVVGVATVLVVAVDAPSDVEAEVLVEPNCVLIRGAGVTGDVREFVGDASDEALAEAVAAVIRCDGEKQDVAVVSNGGEADQLFSGPVDVDEHLRASVGVVEEAASLSEYAVGLADQLLEFPGGVRVVVAPPVDDVGFDVDAHWREYC